MSTGTAKEVVSIVDPLESQKHDVRKLEVPESSSCGANEVGDPPKTEEGGHKDLMDNSNKVIKDKLCNTRYFIIKSLNHENIQLSFQKGIWATQLMNEPILEEAFNELSPEIGEALCQLIDREAEEDPSLNRDAFLVRTGVESGYCFPDEGYIAPSMDMTWATKTMLYPSRLYQYHTEASGSLVAHHGSVGVFPSKSLPVTANKGSLTRQANRKGSILDSPADHKFSSQVDGQRISSEMSPLCSTLSEDEFLEMSYEEYVEAHSRGIKQGGRKSRGKEESSSKEHDDDLHSHSDHGNSHKRSRH